MTNVVFACGSIEVSYELTLVMSPALETSAQQYFDDVTSSLVAAADSGTLLSAGNDVDSSSFELGTMGNQEFILKSSIITYLVCFTVFVLF